MPVYIVIEPIIDGCKIRWFNKNDKTNIYKLVYDDEKYKFLPYVFIIDKNKNIVKMRVLKSKECLFEINNNANLGYLNLSELKF